MPEAPPLPPKHPPPGLHIATDDLVKPLFCVHFPASPSGASTSTVHLRRKSSLGHGSNPDSVSSVSANWWSAGGSGRRWSGIGLGMARDLDEQDVEVDFVEGQFALPTSAAAPMSPNRIGRKTSQRRRQRSEVTDSASTAITSADTSDTDGDDDHSSTWSGTQRAGSFVNRHTSWSSFIGGSEDDIPRSQVLEGKVCVVGGTMVIRGVRSDEERHAVQKVLQLVVSAAMRRVCTANIAAVYHSSDDPRAGASRCFPGTTRVGSSACPAQRPSATSSPSLVEHVQPKGFHVEPKVVT